MTGYDRSRAAASGEAINGKGRASRVSLADLGRGRAEDNDRAAEAASEPDLPFVDVASPDDEGEPYADAAEPDPQPSPSAAFARAALG
ncbi:hypothetical protein ACIKTA_15575, partial [Hansschlegelia beijingensis]